MSNHTQVPWVVGGPTEYINQLSIEPCIATVYGAGDELTANANLIAAAPDLLAACKTFAEWLHHDEQGPVYTQGGRDAPGGEAIWREWWQLNLDLCREARELVGAAIAQAEGES